MMLSIDPGLNHVGWALWEGGRLDNAGLARAARQYVHEPLMQRVHGVAEQVAARVHEASFCDGEARPIFDAVVEVPQVYRVGRSRGNPNDIVAIALVVGAVVGSFPNARWHGVLPHAWKGSIKGDIMTERIRAGCSLIELGYFVGKVPKSLQHNVLDAIGLGRWWGKNRSQSCE